MHLLVKNPKKLTRSEKETLRRLYEIDRRLRVLRGFTQRLHEIFQAPTAQAARNRQTRLLGDRVFQREPHLQPALKQLRSDEVCEKLIFSLSWHHVPRTNNHVERKNRAFRLVQKTRYKRRAPT
jgi:transposase-like protein